MVIVNLIHIPGSILVVGVNRSEKHAIKCSKSLNNGSIRVSLMQIFFYYFNYDILTTPGIAINLREMIELLHAFEIHKVNIYMYI